MFTRSVRALRHVVMVAWSDGSPLHVVKICFLHKSLANILTFFWRRIFALLMLYWPQPCLAAPSPWGLSVTAGGSVAVARPPEFSAICQYNSTGIALLRCAFILWFHTPQWRKNASPGARKFGISHGMLEAISYIKCEIDGILMGFF